MLMDKEQIKGYIPHRDPMLMIDSIEELEGDQKVVALKRVEEDEPHFKGHFPGHPIMPGVLIVEAMAQAAGVMMFKHYGYTAKTAVVYFMKLDKVRFRKPVTPPEVLRLEIVKLKEKASICSFKGFAYNSENTLVTEAEFMAKVMPR